uniref:Replication-associated protein n=1 Tax=ssDNA virus sp. TaxID=2593122 RepID=A0A894JRY2_9VIRU|nr:replication-associated protein [ssDNA virus sp.]
MATEVLATEARGNTKARAYQLTLNQPEKLGELLENMKQYKSLDYYMVSHLEVGEEKQHEHYHIYLHFRTPLKLNIKKCCGAHIEFVKGTYNDNLKYFTKQGELTDEWGEKPHQGLKTVKELKEMNIEEVPPQYYRIKKEIDAEQNDENNFFEMLDEIEKDELKAPKIIYITGGTGKGKTYKAYKIALQNYEKKDIGKLTLKNDFFDVINKNAKCFVIEEFRPSQIKASDFLQLTDKYGYRANIKGGFVSLRPEMIIICSIIEPEKIYKEEINQQFIRRITEIINLDIDEDMY